MDVPRLPSYAKIAKTFLNCLIRDYIPWFCVELKTRHSAGFTSDRPAMGRTLDLYGRVLWNKNIWGWNQGMDKFEIWMFNVGARKWENFYKMRVNNVCKLCIGKNSKIPLPLTFEKKISGTRVVFFIGVKWNCGNIPNIPFKLYLQ